MVNTGQYFAQSLWAESENTEFMPKQLQSETQLISAALSLGARSVEKWSIEERALRHVPANYPAPSSDALRIAILHGGDPLGDALCALRSPEKRRGSGATFTPLPVADAMVSWAGAMKLDPSRIIEPGSGSARFLLAAAKIFPNAELVGIETDPVTAIIARANLAVSGLAKRATIILGDYRKVVIPVVSGSTLYIGNPPYVRHHQLDLEGKRWLTEQARKLGLAASQLAGLHVHFFLATALKARKGDFGCFITSAEWLDVNYGELVRQLFLNHLGGQGITVVEPTSRTFSDVATTSAITQFVIGSAPEKIRIRRSRDAASKQDHIEGRWITRDRFIVERRWSILTRKSKVIPEGYVELGEFCRVHRGQVTGANRIWIANDHSTMLPGSVLFPTVTRAKELFGAGKVLSDTSRLRDVIDIPSDLSIFDKNERKSIDKFLDRAKALGADSGYVARNRRAWWSVGLRSPAPILATYMARRTPAFVRNLGNARHINIAHGIYPREVLSPLILDRLAQILSSTVSLTQGRTYAGGLTKFEPKEMERILIPNPTHMESMQLA